MGKKLIAGNWKMNLDVERSCDLAKRVEQATAEHHDEVDIVICPTMLALTDVAKAVDKIGVGAQNAYFVDEGAYTGEVSATQLQGVAQYVIVGHSERRQYFQETNEAVARKTAACLRNELTPIVCIGETGYEREHGETTQVLNDQLATCLTMLVASDLEAIVVAYEPVWAIGTGDNAKPDDVLAAIKTIRSTIREMFGEAASDKTRVLYGGSVKGETATAYLNIEGVDGLLVGGASLDDHEFSQIVGYATYGG